jgi:hypothetical protein
MRTFFSKLIRKISKISSKNFDFFFKRTTSNRSPISQEPNRPGAQHARNPKVQELYRPGTYQARNPTGQEPNRPGSQPDRCPEKKIDISILKYLTK